MSEKGSFNKFRTELPQPEETLALGFDPNNSSLEYLDKLRVDTYAKGGEDSEEFRKYNDIYVEKLSSYKEKFENSKKEMPFQLDYTENFDEKYGDKEEQQITDSIETEQESFEGGKDALESENEKLKSENQELKKELADLKGQLQDLMKLLESNNDTISQLTQEVQKLRDLANNKSGVDKFSGQDVDVDHKYSRVEKNEKEKSDRKEKFKKIGKFLGKMVAVGSIFLAVLGLSQSNNKNNETNNSSTDRQEFVDHNADVGQSKKSFLESASLPEVESNHELDDNGKYDSQNDEYNRTDKENKYSIGNSTAELSNEEYQSKYIDNFNEDNIHRHGQFFINDLNAAKEYLGLENKKQVDELIDEAYGGNVESFQKLKDATAKYLEGAKVVGHGELGNDTWHSMYVNEDHNYLHSTGEFGGTYRIIRLSNGTEVLIRDQCQQIIMKQDKNQPQPKWNTPPIPFSEIPPTSETPPPTSETPPPTSETPPPTSETPPPTSETPPPTSETPPPTSETPPENIEVNYSKDWTKIAKGTFDNVDEQSEGELTEAVTEDEQKNSIKPNAQSGENIQGVVAEGATFDAGFNYGTPSYEGEVTAEGLAQQNQNAKEAQEQENNNAKAAESAKSETVKIGDIEYSLEDIKQAQNQNGGINAN